MRFTAPVLLATSMLFALNPAQAEVRLEAGDDAASATYLAQRGASRGEGLPMVAVPRGGNNTASFLLPFFQVDTTSGGGTTTLYAVRNPTLSTINIDVEYRSEGGALQQIEFFELDPGQVLTRNLRDVPGLPVDFDGFARGYVLIQATDPGELTGDFFLVTPGEDFASGSRLPGANGPFTCLLLESRYGVGGAFDGGTRLTLWTPNPLGVGAMADPTATFAVFGEDGILYGTVDLFTDLRALEVEVVDILDAVPGAPAFGAIEIQFDIDTGGGVAFATFTAADRYSLNLEAACLQGIL